MAVSWVHCPEGAERVPLPDGVSIQFLVRQMHPVFVRLCGTDAFVRVSGCQVGALGLVVNLRGRWCEVCLECEVECAVAGLSQLVNVAA